MLSVSIAGAGSAKLSDRVDRRKSTVSRLPRLRLAAVGVVAMLCAAMVWTPPFRPKMAKPLPVGQCTWYAAERALDDGWMLAFSRPYGRHAKEWPKLVRNARLAAEPAPGSLLVLDAWPGNPYGHVAYVERVRSPVRFSISHANMAAGALVRRREGVAVRVAEVEVKDGGLEFGGRTGRFRVIGFLVRR